MKAPPSFRNRPTLASSRKSGKAILDRNAFDSVTGPLFNTPVVIIEDGYEEPVDFSTPYAAPECQDAKLLIVAAAEDAEWSMAAFQDKASDVKFQMRRVGDSYGAKTIWHIAWDRVWLYGGGELCQIKMFEAKYEKSASTSGR